MDNLLLILGLYVLLNKLTIVYEAFYSLFLIKGGSLRDKFPGKYGKKPWAVVTGCTAGIGEEIAYRLAKEGFNLVLISRNLDKLKVVEGRCKLQ